MAPPCLDAAGDAYRFDEAGPVGLPGARARARRGRDQLDDRRQVPRPGEHVGEFGFDEAVPRDHVRDERLDIAAQAEIDFLGRRRGR